ncbi:DUF4149 domain-containing protein [Vibrio breoganii]|uniref:DUF4149 domain-containing protein n=2 Tax=Vibrio TaxID=662 RepID=A0AAP8MSI2_9VIBR|nr:DUF4149 domain-containing protein [Vibrio breoganii]NMO74658.1 DUF4149 domain-containing protein [Vibrio breoganii]NMR71323.1 DUF4149 domain-containing protein [Vibrio breoganii]OCH73247.1 hypothetical protein A6D95_16565 [Vibrio breoganii]OED96792.1 hypothetical protein A1QG_16140 [Vibrio breoganii ZF-29]PMF87535.1 hypothetical protein BCV08_12890 [Vibrio breoganii]
MNLLTRTISIVYVIALTSVIAFSLFAGAVVAPVIFNSSSWLGESVLNRFQEGLMMTEVFVRLSYPLIAVCLVSLAYELWSYWKKDSDWIALVSMSLMVGTGLLFGFYFIPEILHLQSQGAVVTQSPVFASIHKTSEICFKITVLSGLVLVFRNILKMNR